MSSRPGRPFLVNGGKGSAFVLAFPGLPRRSPKGVSSALPVEEFNVAPWSFLFGGFYQEARHPV
ncbi:MAG: hypothetical protein ACRD5K_10780, partial [Candidatus Acidiferrales bacterium]